MSLIFSKGCRTRVDFLILRIRVYASGRLGIIQSLRGERLHHHHMRLRILLLLLVAHRRSHLRLDKSLAPGSKVRLVVCRVCLIILGTVSFLRTGLSGLGWSTRWCLLSSLVSFRSLFKIVKDQAKLTRMVWLSLRRRLIVVKSGRAVLVELLLRIREGLMRQVWCNIENLSLMSQRRLHSDLVVYVHSLWTLCRYRIEGLKIVHLLLLVGIHPILLCLC